MVSQSEHVPVTTPTGTTVTDDRGIRQPVAYASYPTESVALRYGSFWGSVIAGSLVAISFVVLSMALMFGCDVGVYSAGGNTAGTLVLSWGSAVWIVITACLALLLGGYVSSALSRPVSTGWLYGLAVWGLTIPLFFILAAIIAGGMGAAAQGAQIGQAVLPAGASSGNVFAAIHIQNGVAWMLFCSVICAAIFGLIGGMSGAARHTDISR
jgi:hypothetical protein